MPRNARASLGLVLVSGALAMPAVATAQDVPPPSAAQPAAPPTAPKIVRAYRPNIADEDWSFLENKALRQDFFDPVKYISLWNGRSYLTLAGEVRIRPEGLRVRAAPGEESTVDNYVFQRYLFAADWHLGNRLRLFGELQSGLIDGKIASPRPTDEDVAGLHQAFVEYHSPKDRPRQVLVRVGRQEMTIGSSRLISARQGLNVKRSFDGLVLGYNAARWSIEGGAARLVEVGAGAFDDTSTGDHKFWGASATRRGVFVPGVALGWYYLGVDQKESFYVQGVGAERRHTVGAKFGGVWKAFDFNYDLIGQWGEFAGAPARAWAVAVENSYRRADWPLRPRFTLRINSATGDRDPDDPRLEAFNPLFPGNSYSGSVGLLGPTNLSDVTPAVQLLFPRRFLIAFEYSSYFRSSVHDGVYNIELRPLPIIAPDADRYVGSNPAIVVLWTATNHLSLTGVITRFLPGAAVEQSFIRHGFGFYSSSFTYRF
jgi:hypothetical protein